jgi:hypothetical protein
MNRIITISIDEDVLAEFKKRVAKDNGGMLEKGLISSTISDLMSEYSRFGKK